MSWSWSIFLWGLGGSFAIEMVSLLSEMRTRSGNVSAYYKNPTYWIVRVAVMGIAGGLAVAEDASKPLLAVNIGASAPAILQLLAQPPKSS